MCEVTASYGWITWVRGVMMIRVVVAAVHRWPPSLAGFVHLRACARPIPVHSHAHFQLLVPLHGVMRLRSHDHVCRIASPGGVLVWPEHDHEMLEPRTHLELFSVLLCRDALTASAGSLQYELREPSRGFMVFTDLDVLVRELVLRLVDEHESGRAASGFVDMAYQCLCAALVEQLKRARSATTDRVPEASQTPRYEHVDRAIAILQRELAAPPRLPELARRVGTSARTLTRLFVRSVGMSPMQYAARVRIEAAAQRLATTELSIETVASELGYASRSHFVRTFRKLKGESPGPWRRR